jgi:2,4-dienoyl-CoA reductase-like NADH-dependent reductase (Old Yellow Enzyme family)
MEQSDIQKTLFEPYTLGDLVLPNRFVMASLTRIRCDPKTGVANDLLVEYYSQRAAAGLILTECSAVANAGNSFIGSAAIYTREQMEGWKKVVDAVHKKGGRIYIQIWHAGRAAHPTQTGEQNISSSATAIRGNLRTNLPHVQPKAMTTEDLELVRQQFRQGALYAKEAGFDGIELHGANGYLMDQFLRDGVNQRTDEYGGSIENRCRFPLEIIDILIGVFGAKRVGMKMTPVGRWQDMYDSDPVALYSYFLQQLDKKGVSYVQLMEPAEEYADALSEPGAKQIAVVAKTFRPYFSGTIMTNNNLTPESATKNLNEGVADLACFGRYFISNPDFVERVQNGWPLNKWDNSTFYVGGVKGFVDIPLYDAKTTSLQTPEQTGERVEESAK